MMIILMCNNININEESVMIRNINDNNENNINNVYY